RGLVHDEIVAMKVPARVLRNQNEVTAENRRVHRVGRNLKSLYPPRRYVSEHRWPPDKQAEQNRRRIPVPPIVWLQRVWLRCSRSGASGPKRNQYPGQDVQEKRQ